MGFRGFGGLTALEDRLVFYLSSTEMAAVLRIIGL